MDINMLDEINVKFRLATIEDAERVYPWRNHAFVRQYALNSAPIPLNEHLQWFKNKLNEKNCWLLIAEASSFPIGVVRLDVKKDSAEVSIYLNPEKSGQGFGSKILKECIVWVEKNLPWLHSLEAKILAENERSIKAFKNAGFHCGELTFRKYIDGEK